MKFYKEPFFRGFIIAMGSFFLIIAAINFLVDPFWYRENRIKYFNYLPINEITNTAPLMNIVTLYSKGPDVKFSVIGTSHVLAGITNCDYPELEKVGFSAMSIPESQRVLQKILLEATVSKIIFIEVCGINDIPPIRDVSFLSKIFSLRTLVYSIRTMKHNLLNDQQLKIELCAPYTPNIDTIKSIDELNSKQIPLRAITSKEFMSFRQLFIFKDVLKNDLKHQVVFFISPLPQETMENEKYRLINQKLSKQMHQVVDDIQSANHQISFKFINLADTEIGDEYQFRKGNFYEGWYDGNHFKPVIGHQVLRYLIGHSK